jgi:OPA family glycerol-3-phosphate transporter-like MFS transporter
VRALSLKSRQIVVIALLFCGYGAYYFCRADLSVSMPLIIEELAHQGLSADVAIVRVGAVASFGVLAYAFGKFFLAGLGDLWGGKPSFLVGLGGATIFTLLFAASGVLPVFTLAWIGNRLTQSIGWGGLIKVSSRWFNFNTYGAIMGLLSLSYLVGDALARQSMGALISHGYGWRTLFCFAAAVAGFMFVANFLLLHESRTKLGFAAATVNPSNLYGESESAAGAAWKTSTRDLILPLLRSPAFLLVCLLSFGCTIVRETFNTWNPVYLRNHIGFSSGHAASLSAIFPAVGAVSVLFAGWLSDRLGVNGRALLMTIGLTASAVTLTVLMGIPVSLGGATLPLVLIGIVAFCLLGPYSYLGGAFALDFGGRRASAAASGFIDGIGYLGGVLAGDSVARISVAFGWHGVFLTLAGVCALSALAAGWLYKVQSR